MAVLVLAILAIRHAVVLLAMAGLPEAEQVERAALVRLDRFREQMEALQILLAQEAEAEVGQ